MPNTAESLDYSFSTTLKPVADIERDASQVLERYSGNVDYISANNFNTAVVHELDVTESISLVDLSKEDKGLKGKRVIRTNRELEDEFLCVISNVDFESRQLSARVYEINDNIQIMDVQVGFDEFENDDISLVKLNAIFYWRMGRKIETLVNKKGIIVKQSSNFSSLKMRRVFSSTRFHRTHISKKNHQFSSVFTD